MVGPRKYKEIIKSKGSFDGVEFPKVKGVDIELTTTQQVEKATKDNSIIKESPPDFKIIMDFRNYNNRREDKELSEQIRIATGLGFSPYYASSGVYTFYTTGYIPIEKKRDIYQKLIDVAVEYVKEKKTELKESTGEFKKDYDDAVITESKIMTMMPYSVPDVKPMFLLILKDKIGGSEYGFLKRESSYSGYLSTDKEENVNRTISASILDVQKYIPGYKKKSAFFLVSEKSYSEVKTFIKSEVAKESFYYEEQIRMSKGSDMKDVEVLTENPFGVKIEYLEEKGVYLFTGKGYKDGAVFNNRTILGMWANNMIYCEPVGEDGYIHSNDFYHENKIKIQLEFLKSGSAKDGFEIPMSYKSKLGTIKDNLLKEMEIWGRETVLIDIKKPVSFSSVWNVPYPVVFLHSDGEAYLCYSARQKNKKEANQYGERELLSTTFKAIHINRDEYHYLMNEHPLKEMIGGISKKVTVLATDAVKSNDDYVKMSPTDFVELYDVMFLNYNMKQDAKVFDAPAVILPKSRAKKF